MDLDVWQDENSLIGDESVGFRGYQVPATGWAWHQCLIGAPFSRQIEK